MHDEVGEVVFVRLGVKEGSPIFRGRIQQRSTNRGELEHPVTVTQHCPIEEPPGGASVPVLERMVVGKPEVERDGADDRVDERPVVGGLVGKPEHFPHPLRKFDRRWRRMQHPLVALVPYPHTVIVRPLDAALGVRIVQGVSGEGGVQSQQDVLRERLRSEATNGLHRPVVVEDHLLAPVFRTPSGANHVLGDDAGGGCTFELARGDCLLDQRIDYEPIAQPGIRHVFRSTNPAPRLTVDPMQGLLHLVGQHVDQRPTNGVAHRKPTILAAPGELDSDPPLLVIQAGGRFSPEEPVPVFVAAADRGTESSSHHVDEALAMLYEEFTKRLGGKWRLHGWGFLDTRMYQFLRRR